MTQLSLTNVNSNGLIRHPRSTKRVWAMSDVKPPLIIALEMIFLSNKKYKVGVVQGPLYELTLELRTNWHDYKRCPYLTTL